MTRFARSSEVVVTAVAWQPDGPLQPPVTEVNRDRSCNRCDEETEIPLIPNDQHKNFDNA
jgi:hypothetical protein